jgi:hypothetical protein
VFHINLLKRYYPRQEQVNYLEEKIEEDPEEIEMEIPNIGPEGGQFLREPIHIAEHLTEEE